MGKCHMPKCDRCGRFTHGPTTAYAVMYSEPLCLGGGIDREIFRCAKCVDKYGMPQSNACPRDGDMSPYQGIIKPRT